MITFYAIIKVIGHIFRGFISAIETDIPIRPGPIKEIVQTVQFGRKNAFPLSKIRFRHVHFLCIRGIIFRFRAHQCRGLMVNSLFHIVRFFYMGRQFWIDLNLILMEPSTFFMGDSQFPFKRLKWRRGNFAFKAHEFPVDRSGCFLK